MIRISRRWVLLAIIIATIALLVPSGAFQIQDNGTDRIDDTIELSPSDSPNGKYALVNTDEEIELQFGANNPNLDGEGVIIGTRTPFHDVFTVTNNGSEPGKIWFTVQAEGMRFYNDTDTDDSLMGESNAINLNPNQTLHVGVFINATTKEVESVEKFTIHAEPLEDSDTGSDTESDSRDDGVSTFDTGPSSSISVIAPDETRRYLAFEDVSQGRVLTADLTDSSSTGTSAN